MAHTCFNASSQFKKSWALSQNSKEYFSKAKKYAEACASLCNDVHCGKQSIINEHLIRCEIIDFDLARFFDVVTNESCKKLVQFLDDCIRIYREEEKEGRSFQLFSTQANYYIIRAYQGDISISQREWARLLEQQERINRGSGKKRDKYCEQIKQNLEVLFDDNVELNKLGFIF